ncbi:MAG: hypothetical protein HS111_01055 [Kofleriaceae bacterium]|nr:hypothetical protein [Kofleriaceae bacterium]
MSQIAPDERKNIFAAAIGVVAMDADVAAAETRFLERLQIAGQIDDATASSIRGARRRLGSARRRPPAPTRRLRATAADRRSRDGRAGALAAARAARRSAEVALRGRRSRSRCRAAAPSASRR